jgi:hypothetical protein
VCDVNSNNLKTHGLFGLTFLFLFSFSFFFHRIAELILHKLRQMGKISEDDISLVKLATREGFEHCDVDQSGTLTASEIILQSSQTDK